jgi:hypothetical protein
LAKSQKIQWFVESAPELDKESFLVPREQISNEKGTDCQWKLRNPVLGTAPQTLPPNRRSFSNSSGRRRSCLDDGDRYQRFLAAIVAEVEPNDILEWIWVRDVMDLQWEILRYRKAKAQLFESAITQAAENALDGGFPSDITPRKPVLTTGGWLHHQ